MASYLAGVAATTEHMHRLSATASGGTDLCQCQHEQSTTQTKRDEGLHGTYPVHDTKPSPTDCGCSLYSPTGIVLQLQMPHHTATDGPVRRCSLIMSAKKRAQTTRRLLPRAISSGSRNCTAKDENVLWHALCWGYVLELCLQWWAVSEQHPGC